MNPTFAEEKAVTETTPVWLKRTLLFLLFGSAIAGFASIALKSDGLFPASPGQQFKSGIVNSTGFLNFSEKPGSGRRNSSDNTIFCQGTLIGENGKAMAVINGQTVSVGITIDGVKIMKITRSHVLVEFNGKTRRLAPGESFTPGKK